MAHTTLPLALLIALLFTACGEKKTTPHSVEQEPVSSLTIEGNDRMRFLPDRFTVRAGEEITLTLRNVGTMPKATMGHNLAILEMGVAPISFATAAVRHPDKAYVAPEYADRVIVASEVLGPGESEVLTFTAPAVPGDYPFVCSFPGHTQAGMKGIMTVVE